MSSSGVQERSSAPRRHLSDRQAQTVAGLTEAAVAELSDHGYPALTVRNVARRAGVAPATAYTYFASKEHLVAEVFWRRFAAQERRTIDRRHSPARRATEVLLDFALVVAGETELSAACTIAVLADDAEVRDLRARIGAELRQRLIEALGDDADTVSIQTVELAVAGALLQVGTGHLDYEALPDLLARVTETVLSGAKR